MKDTFAKTESMRSGRSALVRLLRRPDSIRELSPLELYRVCGLLKLLETHIGNDLQRRGLLTLPELNAARKNNIPPDKAQDWIAGERGRNLDSEVKAAFVDPELSAEARQAICRFATRLASTSFVAERARNDEEANVWQAASSLLLRLAR